MYVITEVQRLTHACTNAQLPKARYYRSAEHNPCLHQRTNTQKYVITEVQSLTHACTNAQLPKACYYRSAKHNPCLHQRTNTKSTLLQKCKAQPVLAPTYQYQKHVITEVQSTTRVCTNVPRRTPSGTSSLVYSAQRGTSPTTYENSPNDWSHIPKQRKKGKKRIPLLV